MGQRRILVIGSQCNHMAPLSFLPKAAQDLYGVMTDPVLGGCAPALKDNGLMLDPSVEEARTAIEQAFQQASRNDDTLLLAYIGHGEYAGDDFYLLPLNATVPPRAHTAVHLIQLIKELHREHSDVDGLVVLLDTCYSGVAAAGAAAHWVRELGGTLRFEVLTAAADRPAADGCFTRNLVNIIQNGLDSVPWEFLRCEPVRKVLEGRCPKQVPQQPTYNADEGLYVSRNVAWLTGRRLWAGTITAAQIEQLTAWFQPTQQLAEVVAATTAERCVVLTGVAGAGKSAIAAALARWEVTGGMVPQSFVQAVAFVTTTASSQELALQLAGQLKTTVRDFAAAQRQFQHQTQAEERAKLDAWHREVIGPLRLLSADRPIRIVIDGLDQISTGANVSVHKAIDVLATDPALGAVRLVLTARSDTPLPVRAKIPPLGEAADGAIQQYLERREVPAKLCPTVVSRAKGNWLIARLLADLISAHPDSEPQGLPPDLVDIYDLALRQVGATETRRWREELRPVLGVLAAAGVGPILPLSLLCAASGKLDGPRRPTSVRDILVDLRGLVVRSSPGTEDEHVGLFHQTLAEYLLDQATAFGIETVEPHHALVEALAELPARAKHDPRDALHRYALAREADHLWEIGRYTQVVASLEGREAVMPAENLGRWKSWYDRIAMQLGKDHADTLRTRSNIAAWTGRTGDAPAALRLSQELLPDRVRLLGKDHPHTLRTRSNIAAWTGETGKTQEALWLFQELLRDQVCLLGKDHSDTLRTRHNIAFWTGATGEALTALRLSQELLPDQVRLLGKDHPDTFRTRSNIAAWTGETGEAPAALRLFQELLLDQVRLLGKDHPHTLRTRSNIAAWTGETGEAPAALRLFQELLLDQVRLLGKDHPHTLTTRHSIGFWTGATGDTPEALRLFQELLPDQVRLLGKDHPHTLTTQHNIDALTGATGDAPVVLRSCSPTGYTCSVRITRTRLPPGIISPP
jgi:hypothetical protein